MFEGIELELGERVVLVGPNNSGKTSALQALSLWNAGVRRWVEKRGAGNVPEHRAGVPITRRDLISVPVPATNLLWKDLHVREGRREAGHTKTSNILIEIDVDGVDKGVTWSTKMEFDYRDEETIICRSRRGDGGNRIEVPPAAAAMRIAYLPPMSGLAPAETRLDEGAIDVRLGEGRTAEVLRNLCWRVLERGPEHWAHVVDGMRSLFGITLDQPEYVAERGEIRMTFRTASNVQLDLSSSGRGQQQTLLLLAYMTASPGALLLLDEPDAHLEILRQRQIYHVLSDVARRTGSQIIAASHSEVILNEAADRDTVIAFVGRPHRIDDRGSQVLKSLREIGFDQYLQAEEVGWILYLEGATDLAILKAFARRLGHPASECLERPFVRYVGNQPAEVKKHFYGIREAKRDILGFALFDRLAAIPPNSPELTFTMWRRREIESYLSQPATLLDYAHSEGAKQLGELFAAHWRDAMDQAIKEIETALTMLGKPNPWEGESKVSDDVLTPLFDLFFRKVGLPNLISKTDFHVLAEFVSAEHLQGDVMEVLNAIAEVARRARPISPLA